MKKQLTELTKQEFNTLKQMGFLWELFPEAPEKFEEITKDTNDIQINCFCKSFKIESGYQLNYGDVYYTNNKTFDASLINNPTREEIGIYGIPFEKINTEKPIKIIINIDPPLNANPS